MHAFPETARDQILVTLELVNQTLGAVEGELRHLERRAAELREFLRLGDAMLGEPCPETPALRDTSPDVYTAPGAVLVDPVETPAPPGWQPAQLTAAQKAKMVLDEVGYALSVQQIIEHLGEREAVNGRDDEKLREALRTALRSHPSMFRRVDRGVYALTAWGTADAAS